MIYKFRSFHPKLGLKYFEFKDINASYLLFNTFWISIEDCEIEQFTGCYDKEGKELYFNDIIEIDEHKDNKFIIPKMQYQIIWDPPFFLAMNNQQNFEEIDEEQQKYITLLSNIHDDKFKKNYNSYIKQ
jgi:hypothetical protein